MDACEVTSTSLYSLYYTPNAANPPLMANCTNEALLVGICNDLPICGFCYDFGQYHKPAREYEIYNLTVIGIILPVIGLMGLIGNSISAFIYSRKCMRVSLNVYLCALAASDITIISTSFFLFFLESMRKRSAMVSKYFALLAPIMFPLGLTAQTLSVFLTLAAAFDCFILVIGSDGVKQRFCTVKTAKRVILTIVVLACGLIYLIYSKYRQDETYFTLYYAYLYTIVMAVGPVVLLIILNSAIVLAMRFSYNKEVAGNNTDNTSDDSTTDVITLVLVVCLFITCNILPLTVNFLELLFNIVNSYLIDLSNLMVVVNSSCNFIIYYAFGSQFRRTLKQYLNHYFVEKKKNKMRMCHECSSQELKPPITPINGNNMVLDEITRPLSSPTVNLHHLRHNFFLESYNTLDSTEQPIEISM
uniref:G-protein coupled receptors family 1 profile domain-containing protein n=1 Tax=Ditylenchus dipsaci TaxID=166011 RepID=A0A915DHA4_9BILA